MKLFAFALRPFDELPALEAMSRDEGFTFAWTAEYPTLENAHLAEGADALSIITNPMTPELLDRYHAMGIKSIATRSIGYDISTSPTPPHVAYALRTPPIHPKALPITRLCLCSWRSAAPN